MKLTIKQIESLQLIVKNGISTVKPASKWLSQLSLEWGFGTIEAGKIYISFDDVACIKRCMLSNGYPLKHDDNALDSRMNAGVTFGDEKLAKAITSQRVFVIFTTPTLSINNQCVPAFRAMDMTVAELLEINPPEAVLIENLEVLLEAKRFDNLLELLNQGAVLVYRGGKGFYSPKGAKAFFEAFIGTKIGFFDFDPAGLSRLGHDFLQALILPDLNFLQANGKDFSNDILFDRQIFKYKNALDSLTGNMSAYVKTMMRMRLAITQEKMLELPLIKLKI